MRDIIVTRNMSLRENLKHVDKEKNKIEYTDLESLMSKYKDVRRMTKEDYHQNVDEIPDMDRYAEKHKLCPYCFQN